MLRPTFQLRVRSWAALALIGIAQADPAGLMSSAQAAEPQVLAVDTEVRVNGVDVACTGVGQTRAEARWQNYGVRIEFSNARNEYLTGVAITVHDQDGRELLHVSCDAPWILLRLPKGAYRVEGRLLWADAQPRSAAFSPPVSGQSRIVLQFLDVL